VRRRRRQRAPEDGSEPFGVVASERTTTPSVAALGGVDAGERTGKAGSEYPDRGGQREAKATAGAGNKWCVGFRVLVWMSRGGFKAGSEGYCRSGE